MNLNYQYTYAQMIDKVGTKQGDADVTFIPSIGNRKEKWVGLDNITLAIIMMRLFQPQTSYGS